MTQRRLRRRFQRHFRRQYRRRLPLILAVSAMIGLVGAYIVVASFVQSNRYGHVHLGDMIESRATEIFIVTWCVWLGASIGSFLNVVAWRMPLGLGINGRSMCPRCRVQLRARDNFPVLGWIALRGRCRSCRLPISSRYPIVESLVGLTISSVAVGELYQLILPHQNIGWHRGRFADLYMEPSVFLTLAYHVIAISISWAIGLIRMDGNRLPAKLVVFAAIVLTVPMLVYPKLMIVSWQMDVSSAWQPDGRYLDAILRVVTALVAAIFFARALSRSICPTADPKLNPLGAGTLRLLDLIAILVVPILVVGWQASVAVVPIATITAIAVRFALPDVDSLGRLAISMPFALTVQLIAWRWTQQFAYWPSEGSEPWVLLVWAAAALVMPSWLRDRPNENE